MIKLKRGVSLATLSVLTVLGTGVATAYAGVDGSSTVVTTTQVSTSATGLSSGGGMAGSRTSSDPKLAKSDAIKTAQTLFPDVFQQLGTPTVNLQPNFDGRQVYELNWSRMVNNNQSGPRLNNTFSSVGIDANTGQVIQYQHNTKGWLDSSAAIPAEKAQAIAASWLKKLAPNQQSEMVLQPQSGDVSGGFAYEFVREVNGVIAPFDNARINLNATGDLVSYSFSWHAATFPSVPTSLLSQTEATNAYERNLNLQLRYQTQFERNGQGPLQLVYAPRAFASRPVQATPILDATSGKLLGLDGKPVSADAQKVLTPIDPSGSKDWPTPLTTPLTESQAEDQVMKQLGLKTSDWSINNSQDATGNNSVYGTHQAWQFDFTNQKTGMNISVVVDATDGVFLDYNQNPMMTSNISGKRLTKAQLQSDADAFVKKIFPNLTGAIAHASQLRMVGPAREVSFSYDFLINGIPVNGFNIMLNTATGDVQFYNLMQDPSAKFPSPDNVISVDAAKAAFIKHAPPVLQYTLPETEKNVSNGVRMQYGQTAILVYAANPKPDATNELDALTGKWIQMPYYGFGTTAVNVPANATPEERAMAMLEANGVVQADEAKAKLSDPMKHDEFIAWLSRAYNMNISGSPSPQFSDVSAKDPYASQISTALMQGWLQNTGELHPADTVTRIQAANWLVDWLGWSGPASHSTFFKAPFSDSSALSAQNIGAATMVIDTGIIGLDNGKFDPSGSMTVGQAALALSQAIQTALGSDNVSQ